MFILPGCFSPIQNIAKIIGNHMKIYVMEAFHRNSIALWLLSERYFVCWLVCLFVYCEATSLCFGYNFPEQSKSRKKNQFNIQTFFSLETACWKSNYSLVKRAPTLKRRLPVVASSSSADDTCSSVLSICSQ